MNKPIKRLFTSLPSSCLLSPLAMKLRLRSLQTKETTRLQVPDSCTLQDLNHALSISHPSPSSPLFTFSLNGKDPLHVSSPQETLHSLGVTSGDLIYFSSGNPQLPVSDQVVGSPVPGCLGRKDANMGGKFETLVEGGPVNSIGPEGMCVEEAENVGSGDPVPDSLGQKDVKNESLVGRNSVNSIGHEGMCMEEAENLGSEGNPRRPVSNTVVDSPVLDHLMQKDADLVEENETLVDGSSVNSVVSEGSDVEGMDVDGKKVSEPYFLRKVLQGEVGGDRCSKKLLVVAVHAVFLESGFVGYDSFSSMRVDGFCVVDEWPSKAFTMSLFYSLPELLGNEGGPEFVKLRFQSLGDFVNVYGSLGKGGSRMCRVSLNGSRFGPVMDLVWGNCDAAGSDRVRIDQEVFEFWKIVKDGLAYPLLIDLCEKCGLGLPPCLMCLPMDLKLKILESLPGPDVARLGCVCVEMRYLSSNNDLWKLKMVEEFGSIDVETGSINWKQKFAFSWEGRKRRRLFEDSLGSRRLRTRLRVPDRHPFPAPRFPIIWGDPDPFGVPHFVGGDYDRLPGLGVPAPARQRPHGFPQFHLSSNFSPNCHLGGSDI